VIAHLSQFPLDTKLLAFPDQTGEPGHLCFQKTHPVFASLRVTVYPNRRQSPDGEFQSADVEVKKTKTFEPGSDPNFETAFPSNCKEMTPFIPERSIKNLIDADMWTEAHHLNVYRAAWERMTRAYHSALASLDDKALSQLHVVTYTIEAWGPLFLGTEVPNRERSIKERAADEEWHRRNSGPFS